MLVARLLLPIDDILLIAAARLTTKLRPSGSKKRERWTMRATVVGRLYRSLPGEASACQYADALHTACYHPRLIRVRDARRLIDGDATRDGCYPRSSRSQGWRR
jgi:hypothetical protein